MPGSTAILGPIQVVKTTPERTGAQVLTQPTFDSVTHDRRVLTYKRIRDIRVDPTIKLARMVVLSGIIHTPWDYEDNTKAPSEAKNIIMDMFEEIRNEFLLLAVYGSLDFGWAPFENSYTLEDGFAKVNLLKPLMQDFTNVVVYMNSGQFAGLTNEPIIIGSVDRSVYLREQYGSVFNMEWEGTDWYGESVYLALDNLSTSYAEVETVANRFDKKISGALWVVYYPLGKTEYKGVEQPNDRIAQSILDKLESSAGVAVPSDIQDFMDDTIEKKMRMKWSIELVTASSAAQSSFIDRQKYLDSLKMRAFGLPERAVLEGTHGTKAEADTHTDIALGTIGIKHNLICSRFNQQVINNVLRLNWGPKAVNTVKIKPAPVIEARYNIIKDVFRLILQSDDTGAIAKQISISQMQKMLGIPTVKDAV